MSPGLVDNIKDAAPLPLTTHDDTQSWWGRYALLLRVVQGYRVIAQNACRPSSLKGQRMTRNEGTSDGVTQTTTYSPYHAKYHRQFSALLILCDNSGSCFCCGLGQNIRNGLGNHFQRELLVTNTFTRKTIVILLRIHWLNNHSFGYCSFSVDDKRNESVLGNLLKQGWNHALKVDVRSCAGS